MAIVDDKPTILLADDDDVGRYVIATMLRRAGFVVHEAVDGQDAYEQVLRRRPDLAVLDVQMPILNGFESCRKLKSAEATQHIPVLLLSATFLETEAQVEGLENGADAYLTQPVEAPVLAATIRALLRARAAEADVRLAELEWRTTFDAITDAVAVLGATGHVQRANRAFRELFGESIDSAATGVLSGVSAGSEIELGARTFRVQIDPVAVHDEAEPRSVMTLSDVTGAKAALIAERTISRALQQSLLPERLPQHDDLELYAWHVAAERDLIVGGDWYDVIESGDNLWLVIADIAGHGVGAAAQAGQLRHSLRAYAKEGFTPSDAIQRLNELVCSADLAEMATMCIAEFRPRSYTLRIVRAGHPPPLLLPAGGSPWLADGGEGVVLGVSGARCTAYDVPFAAGDRVVLYTDGLVERPGEIIDDSLARLRATAGQSAGLQQLQHHLVSELIDAAHLRDDVALLIARRS